jgi:hypothetical protein
MYKVFGFSFTSFKGFALFIVLLAGFIFSYHKLVQRSIQNHSEATYRAVREHCRFEIGKQLHQIPDDEFSEKFQSCDDFHIKSVAATGGVINPVFVKITLETPNDMPLDDDVFIFKSTAVSFRLLSGLYGLSSGQWDFNFYVTYSDFMFNSSF